MKVSKFLKSPHGFFLKAVKALKISEGFKDFAGVINLERPLGSPEAPKPVLNSSQGFLDTISEAPGGPGDFPWLRVD